MYKYNCSSCGEAFDLQSGLTGYDCEGYCPCGGTVEYQNPYLGCTLLTDSYVQKIKTIGQLADANMKRMGKAEVEERLASNKTKKAPAGDNMSKREMELPKGSERKTMTPTKIDRSLVGATKEQLIKYIETGVKPVKSEPTMKERKQLRREKQLEKQGKKTRIIST